MPAAPSPAGRLPRPGWSSAGERHSLCRSPRPLEDTQRHCFNRYEAAGRSTPGPSWPKHELIRVSSRELPTKVHLIFIHFPILLPQTRPVRTFEHHQSTVAAGETPQVSVYKLISGRDAVFQVLTFWTPGFHWSRDKQQWTVGALLWSQVIPTWRHDGVGVVHVEGRHVSDSEAVAGVHVREADGFLRTNGRRRERHLQG